MLPCAPSPQPNNGMHPTADTLLVSYLQTLGAAGDAGRYAAVWQEGTGLRGAQLATTYRGSCGLQRELDAA